MRFFQLTALLLLAPSLFAQIDGANVFGTDQVIRFELTFYQTGYWDSLTTYYSTTGQYMSADVSITDNTGTYTYPNVGIRLKGNSSYGHPGNKKSFKIDFNEYVSGQNYDGLKKLNFNNCFKDPSFMREKVFNDICQLADVPAPRSNYADVYFNGAHWGFYSLVEQIDDQFLDWAILEDSGNLFKAGSNFGGGGGSEADLAYYGATEADYGTRYELKTNETANDWTDLIDFIDYVDNSTNAAFEADFDNRLEHTDILRGVALDNLFANLDTYINSTRNYYLYHNMITNKWEWIKWDGNEAFGNYNGGVTGSLTQLDPDYVANGRPLVEQIFASTNLYEDYLVEMCDLMNTYFNSAYMDTMIDNLETLISSYVFADANKMYTDANFTTNLSSDITGGGGPGGGTIYGLKSFVSSRYSYLQGVVDCSYYTGVEEESSLEGLSVFPNPTNGRLYIDLNDREMDGLTISVYALDGQLLENRVVNNPSYSTVQLDLSGYPAGLYLLSLDNGTARTTARISIMQ